MTASRNPLVLVLDIFRAPSASFIALHQHGSWGWQPFILLMISPFLFWGAYFSSVNFDWLSGILLSDAAQLNSEQAALLTPETLMVVEIINDITARVMTLLMLALWFMLATRASQAHGFWKWFAAASVMLFPAVLGDFASYASLTLNQNAVVSYAADLNSLNGLLKLPLSHPWSGWASAFPLLLPWYIVLGYAAVLTWTPLERGQALVIASLPWLSYFIIWALVILIAH
ncbi:YIP1 family protein [Vibrio sp. SM6]|uniref:YIP1 family protein n=1 Tax=Vibrio agarilyticus TaxID=2726741 RepID=A0A7X8TR10_9VIBR|nr:YIP1 family protein [Vibrio agarilyticus]NLS13174.1 YIP1 family protein [Vibrio agarilyticus]